MNLAQLAMMQRRGYAAMEPISDKRSAEVPLPSYIPPFMVGGATTAPRASKLPFGRDMPTPATGMSAAPNAVGPSGPYAGVGPKKTLADVAAVAAPGGAPSMGTVLGTTENVEGIGTAQAAAPSNWGRYLGAARETEATDSWSPNDPEAQAALAWVRQFDPDARFMTAELSGERGVGNWLQYDNSKLPVNAMGGRGIERIQNLSGLQDADNYRGPAARQDDVYGTVGDSRYPIQDQGTWLDIAGPAIMAAITGGAGLAFGGNSLGMAAGNALRGVGNGLSNGDWFGAGLSLLPVGGAAAGIPSMLTGGATTLARLARGKK